ncbi:MAG: sulfate transporter [Xanthomonadales bacterium]|nr:sulfate transporter [Xanthomonadales bacterium]
MSETQIPAGYMEDSAGRLVPESKVRESDKLRDDVARRLSERAMAINAALRQFKIDALAELEDLVEIAAERHDVKIGGDKGNLSIITFNGRYKVERAYADRITFTEEIKIAKKAIDDCITRWSEGANDNIKVLVDRAFRTDRQGNMRSQAVLELLRYDIDDPEWETAMDALRESIQVSGTAVYVRVYTRCEETDRYEAIPLNLAAV